MFQPLVGVGSFSPTDVARINLGIVSPSSPSYTDSLPIIQYKYTRYFNILVDGAILYASFDPIYLSGGMHSAVSFSATALLLKGSPLDAPAHNYADNHPGPNNYPPSHNDTSAYHDASKISVLTNLYDNARSGNNPYETKLTPAVVASSAFGLVATYAVQGAVYSQPLIMAGVAFQTPSGIRTTTGLFVSTQHNMVYGFDADAPGSAPLWSRSLGTPTAESDISTVRNCGDIAVEEVLWALSVRSGASVVPPAVIGGTGSSNGQTFTFIPNIQNNRVGLAFDGTNGWMFAFNAVTLQQVGVFLGGNVLSNSGFWQSGSAPCIDSSGYLYINVGNGKRDLPSANFGNTLLKLQPPMSPSQLWQVNGVYQPMGANYPVGDADYGSSGPTLANVDGTPMVLTGGKPGIVYLMPQSALPSNGSGFQTSVSGNGLLYSSPIWYKSSTGLQRIDNLPNVPRSGPIKMVVPIVANGFVYVGYTDALVVFGVTSSSASG
ncbi:hypothetical protein WJX81_004300 [Elliptochloris bilobata]|uniref:Pyrrolo-quinoline quinone n=1 Tax=Elliptochloris bilobata TaxID=381761 RepID=A0AAW1RWI7_9CHLO